MDELKKEFWSNLPDSEKKEFIDEAISSGLKELGHEPKDEVVLMLDHYFESKNMSCLNTIGIYVFKELINLIEQDSAFSAFCENRGDRND